MRSSVYEGSVVHRRVDPLHRFTYRLALPLLDLDEVEQLCRLHPLWSVERPNAISYRRSDFLPDRAGSLDHAVRELVAERTGRRPEGPITLLAHLRTWGWLFNPVSLYFCSDRSGAVVEHLVLEVTNTPWHERHCYVVGGPGRHRLGKALHVSPFLEMDQQYVLDYSAPGDRLHLRLENVRDGRSVAVAVLSLTKMGLDRRALGRVLWRYPLMTAQVSVGIYRQALALRRAGAPFVPHPGRGERRRHPFGGGCTSSVARNSSTAATALVASRPVHPSAPSALAADSPTPAPPTSTGTDVERRTASTTAFTSDS